MQVKQFNESDIKAAKNLLKAFDKMTCGPDMLGIEARALVRALYWLEAMVVAMENPPPPPSVAKSDESNKPARVIKKGKK